MPSPKSKKPKALAQTPAAPTPSNLPKPQRVPKNDVGETVQDFVSFGSATIVQARQESGAIWVVSALA